jgi:hypothetical protein
MITLRPDQQAFIANLRAAFKQHRSVLGMAATGFGKCLGKGTPVMMYDGYVKNVEDVLVGDVLMGPDGGPRNVTSTCVGTGPLYRVTPTKGMSYVVNDAHILSLRMTNGGGSRAYPARSVQNINVLDYLAETRTFRHCAKGWRAAVDFQRHSDRLVLDPYFLGLWLSLIHI